MKTKARKRPKKAGRARRIDLVAFRKEVIEGVRRMAGSRSLRAVASSTGGTSPH